MHATSAKEKEAISFFILYFLKKNIGKKIEGKAFEIL